MGKDKFYVYVLLNQKHSGLWRYKDITFNYKPFYVGIGVDYRMTSHFTPFNLKKKSIKNNIIKSIIKEFDELPIHYKIYENLNESEAKRIEMDFIRFFGKIKDSTGILSNLTDGGDGIIGFNHSQAYKMSLNKKVYQYSLDGIFINEWPSLKSVIESFKLSGGNGIRISISKGIQCKGFLWSYVKHDVLPRHVGRYRKRFKYGIVLKDGNELYFDTKEDMKHHFGKEISMGNVSSCCGGKIESYLGYKWVKYKII